MTEPATAEQVLAHCEGDVRGLLKGARSNDWRHAGRCCQRLSARLASRPLRGPARRLEQLEALEAVAAALAQEVGESQLRRIRRLEPLLLHLTR